MKIQASRGISVLGRRLVVEQPTPSGKLAPPARYTLRGVCWSPASDSTNTTPDDPNNATKRRQEFGRWYRTDVPLMRQMHVNTIRTFLDLGVDSLLGPIGRAVLDTCYANGIMVIMTVDDAVNDTIRVKEAVGYYKNHPAILLWLLGNEWNINRYYEKYATVLQAAQATEAAARIIKRLDPNHPIATSYGEITNPSLASTESFVNTVCPSVDVWGLQVYRGSTFGCLFQEWESITETSKKPMLLAEFGIDAFHTTVQGDPPQGAVNELEQAQWDRSLWDHLAQHLSSRNSAHVCLGGTVFEWNDEWWKVPPPGSQQTGGWQSPAFPDSIGNEEYFGIVDIHRVRRQVCDTLTAVYGPAYLAPPVPYAAVSAGALVPSGQCGYSPYGYFEFWEDGCRFCCKTGGGGGGRGFNAVVINTEVRDSTTAAIEKPCRNFDTWGDRFTGRAARRFISYLDSVPPGQLVLLAVCDDAGLNVDNSCTRFAFGWVDSLIQALESLGSTQIRSYCFRDSWSLAAYKGEGQAEDEQHASGVPVSARTGARIATAAAALPGAGLSLWLEPGFPNPFNPQTKFTCVLPRAGRVRLTIHDVRGRLVATLLDRDQDAGRLTISWDGRATKGERVSSGVYLVRLAAGGVVRSRSVVLVR